MKEKRYTVEKFMTTFGFHKYGVYDHETLNYVFETQNKIVAQIKCGSLNILNDRK